MSQLQQEMTALAKAAGGSHKTVHDRIHIVKRLCRQLREMNIQIRRVQHLKTRHIASLIAAGRTEGRSPRTLQNERAALMAVLCQAGRHKLANSPVLTSVALGIAGGSRNGTKRAIPDTVLQPILTQAWQYDPGLGSALLLSRLLGLRSQEAVQCAASLPTWQRQLARGNPTVTVIYGTKGGRPRETQILNRETLAKAINDALVIANERDGKLIDRSDLRQAMNYWRAHTVRLGLTGEYSPHSLRYARAQEAMAHYLHRGYSRREALAMISMDLGHGDGRGRYVAQVYLRGEDVCND